MDENSSLWKWKMVLNHKPKVNRILRGEVSIPPTNERSISFENKFKAYH